MGDSLALDGKSPPGRGGGVGSVEIRADPPPERVARSACEGGWEGRPGDGAGGAFGVEAGAGD